MSLRSIQPFFVCICAVCLSLIWPVGICSAKSQKTKIPLCSGRDPNICVCGKWIQSNVAVLMPCCLDLPSSFLTNAPLLPQTQLTLRFRLDGTSAKLTSRCLCQLSYIRSYTDFCVYLGCTTMKNLSQAEIMANAQASSPQSLTSAPKHEALLSAWRFSFW